MLPQSHTARPDSHITGCDAVAAPAGSITGGTEDTGNTYSNVGMVVFYQPDGRFRCSGTLISPTAFLTASHCTAFLPDVGVDPGEVFVTFDGQSGHALQAQDLPVEIL